MVEPWVYDLDLGDGDDEFDGGEDGEINPRVSDAFRDPDEPVAPTNNKKRSTKQSRVGFASVACRQSNICIRQFYSAYLHDTLPSGIINSVGSISHCSRSCPQPLTSLSLGVVTVILATTSICPHFFLAPFSPTKSMQHLP